MCRFISGLSIVPQIYVSVFNANIILFDYYSFVL